MKQTTGTGYIVMVTLLAIASLIIIGSVIANDDVLAGKNGQNQANSGTNSCGNELFPNNVLCSNTDSQVQGDKNAAAITSLQEAASSLVDGIVKGFLLIKTAIIEPFNEPQPGLNAFLITHGLIPENGEGGAFGYGLLTAGGDSIIVTTTHAGVLDSQTQGGNKDNPIWHNHFVQLTDIPGGLCPANEIATITFEQPGAVDINGRTASLLGIPSTFSGTDALTNDPLTLSPGNDVEQAVSFTLEPKFDSAGALQAVCVNDITPAENLIIR